MRFGNLAFVDLAPREESFREAALAGLAQRQKAIPCRFLYDERGSALFDEICRLPEYYITRTEIDILAQHAPRIAALAGPRCQFIEFGSGAGRKVRLLLEAFDRPHAYIAVDISSEFLKRAAAGIGQDFPNVKTVAVCADFTGSLRLAEFLPAQAGRRIVFFPGSTIGNLTPEEAMAFLRRCRRLLGPGGDMIVGVDLKKDLATLHAAYNDSAGVTARFSLNLLERMNRGLEADFDIERFSYEAFYNPDRGRIEIHIRSLLDQIVRIGGTPFRFAKGERIHIEYSYKYSVAEFRHLAERAGFETLFCWTDQAELFSIHYMTGR